MPVRNRPILAHSVCPSCEKPITLHMVMRGKNRKGDLYSKGCDCGCVQDASVQNVAAWLKSAKPVEGWQELVIPERIKLFDQVQETDDDQVEETDDDQVEETDDDQVPAVKKGVLYAVGAVALGALVFLGVS